MLIISKRESHMDICELPTVWMFLIGFSTHFVKAKKYNLTNTYSNYSSILTYDESGYNEYSNLLDDYDAAYEIASEQAGIILMNNLQDQTSRTGLALAGWKPKRGDMKAQAVEWWKWGIKPFCFSVLS